MEELQRDPLLLGQGLCQPTGGEAAPAGCKSPGSSPRSRVCQRRQQQGSAPGCASPRRAQGKCLVSTRAGQGQHSSSCTSTCPSLRDRAPSCSKGEGASRPGARPGRKGFLPAGSSAPHLPVPKDRSSAPAWVRQEILQGPVCPGWLMRSLRHCSQKLWEGGGTSEAVSDIKTRSPRQLTGICPNPGWAASRVWVSVPSGDPMPTLMPHPQQRWGRSSGREAGAPHGNAQGAEQRSHPILTLLWPLLGSGSPEDQTNPTRDSSGTTVLPTASSSGTGRVHPLHICHSWPVWLAGVRTTLIPGNTTWSERGSGLKLQFHFSR